MDKSIITFSANEQNLQKTGGIGCYASDTVSYIEAQFALGENWSGYDSIRAVWFNDYKTISTVLDSDGVCIVPHEVLTSRGKVMVNLVGSVLVSDELKDRLTTFPCEALKVSAKAKISGSETAEITPSQFDQFVDIVIAEVEKVTGMTAQAETLPAGSQATARYEDGILYLGIPQGIRGERGETGADGADGNGIASVVYNADYSLTLVFDNGERFTTPPIRGERGPAGADGRDGTDGADGVTPNISIGNVTTLEPSEDAYVTRRGTDANPIFDFGIPKGDKGDNGTVPDLDLILPTDTASGDIASITDGQNVVPVKSLKVTLEPIQDLHGYDKPWAGGAGKNLIPYPYNGSTVSQNGVTVTVNNDGTIVLNGTATPTAYLWLIVRTTDFPSWLKPNTEYVVSGGNGSFNSGARVQMILYGSPSWTLTEETGVTPADLSAYTGFAVVVQILNGTTCNNTKIYPQIELGSTPTSFAPYENICPISGHTECVTSVSGVNVWDEEWEVGSISTLTGDNIESASQIRAKNYVPVVGDETYRMVTSETPNGVWMLFYDGNKSVLTDNLPPYTAASNARKIGNGYDVPMPSDCAYVRFYFQSGYGTTYNHDASINYPSTDHDYHAYNGNTYTTTLGRTVYGGTLDVVSGELTVDRAMIVLDGTQTGILANWTPKEGKSGWLYPYSTAEVPTTGGSAGLISDKLATTSYERIWAGDAGIAIVGGTAWSLAVRIEESGIDTVEKVNAWVAEHPITVVYPLATPQTYQLDPQTISLLHGNNNVWSDGEVELTYNADVGLYIDKKLGTSDTSTLSMTRTLAKSEDTDDTKSEETETKSELTKSDNIQLAED